MMDDREKKTYTERIEYLKSLITKEFPPDSYEISFNSIISVSLCVPKTIKYKERIPSVRFSPEENCMTDIDNGFENIFKQGILIAKDILKNPPLPDKILQGSILLQNNGAIFEKRPL
jgi:hypothetical protein